MAGEWIKMADEWIKMADEWVKMADEWIKKLWYIYTMEYYSIIKRNAFESVLMRWMNLEPIVQSEIIQKEKDKSCMLTHIYGT